MSRERRRKAQPAMPHHRAGIPQEYSSWITGRSVDISTASSFYRKRWDIYRAIVLAEVEDKGGYRYVLKARFFKSFSSCLRNLHDDKALRRLGNENVVAEALCCAASSLVPREPTEDVDMADISHLPLWPQSNPFPKGDVLNLSGEEAPPKSEAWRRLGNFSPAVLEAQTLRRSNGGTWKPGWDPDGHSVRITPDYDTDRTKLPKLTIEIQGEPICLLIKASQDQSGADFEEAERLWERLLHWLSVSVGLHQATGGRPPLRQGERAAYLKDHLGLPSWDRVARRLCQEHPDGQHTNKCGDNFRKQAGQYWERLRKDIQERLPSAAQRN